MNDLNLKYVISGLAISISAIAIITVLSLSSSTDALDVTPKSVEPTTSEGIMVTNGLKHTVPLDQIRSGGPPKDGIPSIDNPKFAPVSNSQFMSDSDTVIGLEINGEAKAYPLWNWPTSKPPRS